MTQDPTAEDPTVEDPMSQEPTDPLSLDRFTPLLGSHFDLPCAEGDDLRLELIEASALENIPSAGRQPFSLLFRGPQTPCLAQASYHLQHAELGRLFVFLVPIQSDPQGTDYEAVFT